VWQPTKSFVIEPSFNNYYSMDFRSRGNAAFKARRYDDALREYTAGIAAASGTSVASVLHLNVAAVLLKRECWGEAAQHCESALAKGALDEKMRAKGLFRLGCAREGEGQPAKALVALNEAARLQPSDTKLLSKIAAIEKVSNANAASLDRIVNAVVERRAVTDFAGTFRTLMDPREFRRLIRWGDADACSAEYESGVPSSLQSVLTDPTYRADLIEMMPSVAAKAESVLEGVKRRGAKAGQTMDAHTESVLRPQIEHEAFAKGVIAMLQRVARRQNAAAANRAALRAAPSHERAAWDQLPSHAIASLANPAACHAVLDGFLGEDGEWCVASLQMGGGRECGHEPVPSPPVLSRPPRRAVHHLNCSGVFSLTYIRSRVRALYPLYLQLTRSLGRASVVSCAQGGRGARRSRAYAQRREAAAPRRRTRRRSIPRRAARSDASRRSESRT
jgi:tetratricopeptide (TPR) repeat protein